MRTTRPSWAARTGVPGGTAKSTPEWGLRGSPLRIRRRPKGLETRPFTGKIIGLGQRQGPSTRERVFRMRATSRRTRARTLGGKTTILSGRCRRSSG